MAASVLHTGCRYIGYLSKPIMHVSYIFLNAETIEGKQRRGTKHGDTQSQRFKTTGTPHCLRHNGLRWSTY